MIFQIKKLFQEDPNLIGWLSTSDARHIKVLVITSEWKKETGKSIFAIFTPEMNFPKFILSMMHDEKYDYYLEREYENLREVRRHIHQQQRQHIPKPVYLGEMLDRQCLVQAAVRGTSLRVRFNQGSSERRMKKNVRMLDKLVDWVLFFESTFNYKKGDWSDTKKLILNELETFRKRQSYDKGIAGALERLSEQVEKNERRLPPPKPQHCDFWVGNVFVRHGKISGVFDWEMFERNSIPFNDLFSLVTHCGFWLSTIKGENYLLNEFLMQFTSPWYAERVVRWFERYRRKYELDWQVLEVLIPIILIKRVNDMQTIIDDNSIQITNTWKELLLYYLRHKEDYLPLNIMRKKRNG